MKDKVVLVTGANGGLGKCVTESLLEAGAIVAGVSRKIQQSDFPNTRFDPFPGDLSSGEGADKIVQNVVARFGRVDVVVHTVGGFAGGKTISETDDTIFDRMLDLYVKCLGRHPVGAVTEPESGGRSSAGRKEKTK